MFCAVHSGLSPVTCMPCLLLQDRTAESCYGVAQQLLCNHSPRNNSVQI
jgi:hypothetical protein